uniref:Uncharacterized protein n=1 Tax=Anguilla anguilla TaxID=7936 RepID=A0A0E9TNK7_ANGAN
MRKPADERHLVSTEKKEIFHHGQFFQTKLVHYHHHLLAFPELYHQPLQTHTLPDRKYAIAT